MTARVLVRPHRPSRGAAALRMAIGDNCRMSLRETIPKQYRHVINWGSGAPIIAGEGVRVHNSVAAVATARDKLRTFRALANAKVATPMWQTEKPTLGKNEIWLARHSLTGSCGSGIRIHRNQASINEDNAPLWVRYIRKETEVRVHVVGDKAIFIQHKKRQSDANQSADEKLIRNHDNGWVFCPRPLSETSNDLLQLAVDAVKALGLTFGAVDVVIDKREGKPYVLEVNTAPGLESPQVIEAYSVAFRELTS